MRGNAMIQQGLMWFDDTPNRSLEDKIALAVQRYQIKYSHAPDICYVRPSIIGLAALPIVASVRVMSAKMVLPMHFWLGVDERIKGK